MAGEVTILSAELAALAPALHPRQRTRFPVHRTKRTQERAEIRHEDRIAVYQRDHFRCVWCGSRKRLTLDHIVPWSANGSDEIDNLRTLCWDCNEDRSNLSRLDGSGMGRGLFPAKAPNLVLQQACHGCCATRTSCPARRDRQCVMGGLNIRVREPGVEASVHIKAAGEGPVAGRCDRYCRECWGEGRCVLPSGHRDGFHLCTSHLKMEAQR